MEEISSNDRPYRRRTVVARRQNESLKASGEYDAVVGTVVSTTPTGTTARKRQHPESSSTSSSSLGQHHQHQQQPPTSSSSSILSPPPPLPLLSTPTPQKHMRSPFIIPFPVPTTIPPVWLIEKVPMILVDHILYSRGLLPMPVHQLFQPPPPPPPPQDTTRNKTAMMMLKPSSSSSSSSSSSGFVVGGSTRRKIRQSQEQIQQLSTAYTSVLSTILMIGSSKQRQNAAITTPISPSMPSLRYLLITIGTTFSQSKELYVIDLQGLHLDCLRGGSDGGDNTLTSVTDNNHHFSDSSNRMSRMEITLRRKLISKLVSVEESSATSSSCMAYNKDNSSNPTTQSQDVPIHQTLPSRNAPSFRLWLTLGFEQSSDTATASSNASSRASTAQNDEENKLIESLVNHHNLILCPNGIPKIRQKPRQSQQARRRRQQQEKLGVKQQNHQATINETVVVQLQQKKQQNPSTPLSGQETSTGTMDNPNITWLSVPTGVKGFRL